MTHKTFHLIKSSDSNLSKVDSNPAELARLQERREQPMAVVVKVASPGYVPSDIVVRAQISPNLFTATVTEKDLHQLEADPQVVSLSTPKRLHPET